MICPLLLIFFFITKNGSKIEIQSGHRHPSLYQGYNSRPTYTQYMAEPTCRLHHWSSASHARASSATSGRVQDRSVLAAVLTKPRQRRCSHRLDHKMPDGMGSRDYFRVQQKQLSQKGITQKTLSPPSERPVPNPCTCVNALYASSSTPLSSTLDHSQETEC